MIPVVVSTMVRVNVASRSKASAVSTLAMIDQCRSEFLITTGAYACSVSFPR